MNFLSQDQPLSQDTLESGAGFFGNPLAGQIMAGHQNFQALEAEYVQPEFGNQPGCRCGHATPRPGPTHPISDIGNQVRPVNAVQSNAPEQGFISRINNSKIILFSLFPVRAALGDESPTVFQRIVRMIPSHKPAKLPG